MKRFKIIPLFIVLIISILGYFNIKSDIIKDPNLQIIERKALANAEYYEIRCSNYNMYVECKATAPNDDPCWAISYCP